MRKVVAEIADCTKCPLHETRNRTVPGDGPLDAKLMLIGEAPGKDEDEQGKPFVGRAGRLLTEALEMEGLNRQKVYIANIIKCRPPDNRLPKAGERKTCLPYLLRQIEIVDPKVIVLLGNTSIKAIVNKTGVLSLRGEFIEHEGRLYLPTLHPSAVLRNRTRLPMLVEDLKLAGIRSGLLKY